MKLREVVGRLRGSGVIARLAGDSLLYGLGQALGRVFQVALVPILTRAFSPEEYGVVDLVMMVSTIATMFTVFGMDAALARSFYEAPDREARRRKAMTSALHRVVAGLVVAAIVVVAAGPLSVLLLDSPSYAKYLRILGFTIPFSSFHLFSNEALRITFQPGKYIRLNVFNMITVGALTLWFVLGLHLSVAGVLYAKLIGDAATAGAGLFLVRHTLTRRMGSWADLRSMLAYGAPLIPVALIYFVLTYADRQVLLRFGGGLNDVGVYAVAVKVAAPVLIAITAFQLAWGPSAFATAERKDHGEVYSRVLSFYVAGGSWLALGIALAAPLIVRIAPAAYWGASRAAGLLALATIAHGAYYIAAVGVNLERKNGWLIVTTGIAAVVTVGLAILLVRPWGVTGVAAATLAGFTVSTCALYVVSQRLRWFPYRGLASLGLFLLAVALSAAGWWMGTSAVSMAVRTLLWLGFALLAWRFAMRPGEPAPAEVSAVSAAEAR